MKRTYEQFICLLKRHGATEEQYKRNTVREFLPNESYARNLDYSFKWVTSAEGDPFWRDINRKLKEWERGRDERD